MPLLLLLPPCYLALATCDSRLATGYLPSDTQPGEGVQERRFSVAGVAVALADAVAAVVVTVAVAVLRCWVGLLWAYCGPMVGLWWAYGGPMVGLW